MLFTGKTSWVKIMCVCRVELESSKMVEKIFPKRRNAMVQATCYENLWANAALLIMIKLMISFMMLTAKIARLLLSSWRCRLERRIALLVEGRYLVRQSRLQFRTLLSERFESIKLSISTNPSLNTTYWRFKSRIPNQTSSVSHKLWFEHCSSTNRHPFKICFRIRFLN